MEIPLSFDDYMTGFKSIVPFLSEGLGEQFHSALIRQWYQDGTITCLSSNGTSRTEYGLPNPRPRVVVDVIVYVDTTPLRPYCIHSYSLGMLGIERPLSLTSNKPIQAWIQYIRMLKVAKARFARIKEELVAAAWAPHRVERLIAAGGFDTLD